MPIGAPLLLLVVFGYLTPSAYGGESLDCAVKLRLPTSMVFARTARSGGTVEAEIVIAQGGGIGKLTVRGPEEALKVEVQTQVGLSTFRPECAGQTVRVLFSFRFEGEPRTDYVPPLILFEPPNRFSIVLRKGRMIVD